MASITSLGLRAMARIAPTTTMTTTTTTTTTMTRSLSTTTMLKKGGSSGSGGGRRKNHAPKSEYHARVRTLTQNMFSPAPAPLRMARLRYLRHWTIHRAWLLLRRQQREATDKERARMQAGMYNACEELRRTVGPGDRGEGYLYRVAMEKKGVWGTQGIPIEYARYQVDYPGPKPWNHEWTR
ncbi:large subunit ribosomal protein L40 [Geosmithia morbida]|uniref:Large subunit ribosomal protein L40 n=1 Tax=Geosmithia morbida TaxID=1094350 RepID=A0A9P4YTK8_9HYPO|nr:large subunit ribosomal protein L40 [Geosmithia morbida]KAF4122307.1 large subunit ribosomal protein L40 [Geosmithia morbida]